MLLGVAAAVLLRRVAGGVAAAVHGCLLCARLRRLLAARAVQLSAYRAPSQRGRYIRWLKQQVYVVSD